VTQLVTIFGYGPSGKAVAELLARRGDRVRVAQRKRPADLPPNMDFQACDLLDAAQVRTAASGANQIVMAAGLAYTGRVWRKDWPVVMSNLVAACEASGARCVFIDNLYMYGPQDAPLREGMTLTGYGAKPSARSEVTRLWMAAGQAGRIRMTALRCPDFYGPGVEQSHLGSAAFGALANGKSAALLANPDMPHDFAYIPDVARAAVTLLDAPDDAYGQAWHMPCAPTTTPREILKLGAQALQTPLKITALPIALLPVIGLFSGFMRELVEMRFQWDRPYRVDANKFAARFWSDVTPFEIGAAAAALSFRKASARQSDASPRHRPQPA
jgi:nucleoside-diphosphate-sugar epimerase